MKRIFVFLFLALVLLASCKPKPYLYKDAEQDFQASLVLSDTLDVLALGQNFMGALKAGEVDEALTNLYVVYDNVLYRVADSSLSQLKARFRRFPVSDYERVSLNFSTPGINDLVYRYSINGPVGSGPAMKIAFNPVKVEGSWYLTLKDAYMSSKDLAPEDQISPYAPAPDTLRLNRLGN